MLNYTMPLSAEESAFAGEHHDLIHKFLRMHKLPESDFYDIAVFGYLRAVRKYLARPELRQYQFSTVAFRAMSCDVHHSREYWKRAKRRSLVIPLNEDTDDLRDTTAESLDQVVDLGELGRRLTPRQRRIAMLRADGYSDREIAGICGMKPGDVTAEMEAAKRLILMVHPDGAARAA
ncbi:MAG: sigma-70 family RNA polymerase sigma factor [Oscillospiraceae bacterium]|nr:sigma-70 family RNA polymerase sigma factor [Oscillospiraceae bacterium]